MQLTYHRQDYRHALPVLLLRRSSLLGGESRIPLDPCIHPVRLVPTTTKMASKLEFALEYGWHAKQVHLRAPDARTYKRWTSLVRAALESGRRPLAACTAERPPADLECSSLASTANSSNNGTSPPRTFHAPIQHKVTKGDDDGGEEEEDEPHLDHDLSHIGNNTLVSFSCSVILQRLGTSFLSRQAAQSLETAAASHGTTIIFIHTNWTDA